MLLVVGGGGVDVDGADGADGAAGGVDVLSVVASTAVVGESVDAIVSGVVSATAMVVDPAETAGAEAVGVTTGAVSDVVEQAATIAAPAIANAVRWIRGPGSGTEPQSIPRWRRCSFARDHGSRHAFVARGRIVPRCHHGDRRG